MLYKHSFSILCGHLNLNQKRKKIEFGRLPVKPTDKPIKPACKPVKPTGIPVRTVRTANFEFKFDFDRYRPVSGQTGPVYRYRTQPVWPDRSVIETLVMLAQPSGHTQDEGRRRGKMEREVEDNLQVSPHGSERSLDGLSWAAACLLGWWGRRN